MSTWTTREGKTLEIDQMHTGHIVNALNMRLRQIAELDAVIRDATNDFTDDFGMDGELATAVGLCREEFGSLDKYTTDIGNLAVELGRRGFVLEARQMKNNESNGF